MMISDPNGLASRRRSLGRLLDYSLNEARELGLHDVAQFLALASVSLEKKIRQRAAKRGRKKPAGATVVNLAEFRGQEGSMGRRPSSRSTRK
jgi:hypothetical protein